MTRLAEPPFFIVGDGRSGTTLLRTCLASHSRLAVPPETHFLKWAMAEGGGEEYPRDPEGAWDRLTAGRRFLDLDVDPDRVRALAGSAPTFRDIFAALLAAYGERMGKPRVGEKTPGHAAHLDRLFAWFPKARVIAIRRDPRAVVASHLKSPWISRQLRPGSRRAPVLPRLRATHIAERARIWTDVYTRQLGRAGDDRRIHTLAYEALVRDPEAELSAILDFLGERFEPAVVAERGAVPGAAQREKLQNAEWRDWLRDHEARATAAISADAVEKWRAELTPAETALIEATCGEAMARFGYAPERSAKERRRAALAGRSALAAAGVERRARAVAARTLSARRPPGRGAGAGAAQRG